MAGVCRHRSDDPAPAATVAGCGYSPAVEHFACGHPRLALGLVTECGSPVPKGPPCGPLCAGYDPGKPAGIDPPCRLRLAALAVTTAFGRCGRRRDVQVYGCQAGRTCTVDDVRGLGLTRAADCELRQE